MKTGFVINTIHGRKIKMGYLKNIGLRKMELDFYTLRLAVGKGMVTEIIDYFATKEEAEKEAKRAFSNYKAIIEVEKLAVHVKTI
jgi:hypothetical protein